MPLLRVYEYAILRYVPVVEREEFLNIGIILYCHPLKYIGIDSFIDEARLTGIFPQADVATICSCLASFAEICAGGQAAAPIGLLAPAQRFRWITARRSTIIQVSDVHPGLCDDPRHQLADLMNKLVR